MPEPLSEFTGKVKQESVEVNGVRLSLGEFDMRTRALWMDVSKEYGIAEKGFEIQTKVIPKISGLSFDIENDPRVKSAQSRIAKLQAKHDELLEAYATPDEPDDIEQQLSALVVRMQSLADELDAVMTEVQEEVISSASEAEEVVGEFMRLQDRARIDFVWRIANAVGKTELELDEFYNRCDGSDYEAAERFVEEGNARWASLYQSRMQRKPSKTSKSN